MLIKALYLPSESAASRAYVNKISHSRLTNKETADDSRHQTLAYLPAG